MHMADALIKPAVAATMYTLSAAAAGYSIYKIKKENDPKKIPLMGVMGAFVFATQMINFTIPGTGSSGHLCGGMLLTAILGPYCAFLTMISVLLIQCLFFADGGLLALGANIWNMAFYGCFVGAFLIWKPMMKKSMTTPKIIAASIIGSILTLQLGAFSVTMETLISGITELPFGIFVATMQPIHLAIGLVEGLITAAVVAFVFHARSELLWNAGISYDENNTHAKLSPKATITTLAVTALVIGGGLSLVASSNPDGLEWSIEKISGSTELEASGTAYDNAANIQDAVAFLPDYGFKTDEEEISTAASITGTSLSGIVGSLIVFALTFGAGLIVKLVRTKKSKAE